MKLLPHSILLLAVATGCYRYSYNGVSYRSASEVFDGQAKIHQRILTLVTPRPEPLVSGCRVVIPSRKVLEEAALLWTEKRTRETIEVLAELVRRDMLLEAHLLEARGICESMTVTKGNGLHVTPTTADTYFYAYTGEPGRLDWYVTQMGYARREITADLRRSDPVQLIEGWLQRVEARVIPKDAKDTAPGAPPTEGGGHAEVEP
jgi:hypothetical protein